MLSDGEALLPAAVTIDSPSRRRDLRKELNAMKIARATNDDMGRMFNFFDNLDEVLGDAEFGEIVSAERLGAIVKKHWGNHGPGVGASWNRVLWGMDTLLRNCTDPEVDPPRENVGQTVKTADPPWHSTDLQTGTTSQEQAQLRARLFAIA